MDISKRNKILMAALEVFDKKGFHDAKISEIAKVAGIGKGTVYEYFDSKGSLFEEMMSFIIDQFMNTIDDQLAKTDDPIEKLNILVDIEWKAATEYSHIMQLMISQIESFSDEMKHKFMFVRTRSFEIVHEIIELGVNQGVFKAVDIEMFSLMFRGAFREAQMNYNVACLMENESDSTMIKERLMKVFIEGIKS